MQQLAGDWAEVDLLMPPGSNPHDFEPQAAQMSPLSDADVLVGVGRGLDEWGLRAASHVAKKEVRIIRMSDSVYPATGPVRLMLNVHLWMDPVRTASFIARLATELGAQFPDRRAQLAARAASLQAELLDMDKDFRSRLAAVPVRELIAYHDAYDPLAHRYGLRVVAHLTSIELAPGGEVTPQDLVQAIDTIRQYRLKVIYAEPQFPGRATEMLQKQTGVRVLYLDDLGGPALKGYDTYQNLLRSDVNALVEGQSTR